MTCVTTLEKERFQLIFYSKALQYSSPNWLDSKAFCLSSFCWKGPLQQQLNNFWVFSPMWISSTLFLQLNIALWAEAFAKAAYNSKYWRWLSFESFRFYMVLFIAFKKSIWSAYFVIYLSLWCLFSLSIYKILYLKTLNVASHFVCCWLLHGRTYTKLKHGQSWFQK